MPKINPMNTMRFSPQITHLSIQVLHGCSYVPILLLRFLHCFGWAPVLVYFFEMCMLYIFRPTLVDLTPITNIHPTQTHILTHSRHGAGEQPGAPAKLLRAHSGLHCVSDCVKHTLLNNVKCFLMILDITYTRSLAVGPYNNDNIRNDEVRECVEKKDV